MAKVSKTAEKGKGPAKEGEAGKKVETGNDRSDIKLIDAIAKQTACLDPSEVDDLIKKIVVMHNKDDKKYSNVLPKDMKMHCSFSCTFFDKNGNEILVFLDTEKARKIWAWLVSIFGNHPGYPQVSQQQYPFIFIDSNNGDPIMPDGCGTIITSDNTSSADRR